MRLYKLTIFLFLAVSFSASASGKDYCINTINGEESVMPPRYVTPIISNGSISLHVDEQGSQNRLASSDRLLGILWEGRRKGLPGDYLFPFGFIRQEIISGGIRYDTPRKWSQSLNSRDAILTCDDTYACGLDIRTEMFVHAQKDIIVVRKHFTARESPVTFRLKYDLPCDGNTFNAPRRMSFEPSWNESSRTIDIRYGAYGLRDYEGIISLGSDSSDDHSVAAGNLSLSVQITPGNSRTVTFFLMFSDNLDTPKYPDRMDGFKKETATEGYQGLFSSHKSIWNGRWSRFSLDIPDENLKRAYYGGVYQLLSNATRWSFPVGIGLWEGRFFAFDETCCFLGLASNNQLDISRRAPEYRKSILPIATYRTKSSGARFVWESMEDGSEGSPQGYWIDHVFHMSHVATAAWTQYLYTNDRCYLMDTAYPLLKECATFFSRHMLVKHPDGSVTFGRCTDLERLGPAIDNPFFSSCGAIYTMEICARAASILGKDEELAASFRASAAALRKTLPRNDRMYVPYEGCNVNSIAVTTGLYPYPVLSTSDSFEREAVMHFYNERYSAGNMYSVGSGLCPWYASWIASALSNYGERDKSLALLREAASQIGYFSEHFEINEKKVVMRPWFTTAAGNFVHAVDQTLLLNREEGVFVCYSAPVEWSDYSFTLPCYGNVSCSAEVRKGKLCRCSFKANDSTLPTAEIIVFIPEYLLQEKNMDKDIRSISRSKDGLWSFRLTIPEGGTVEVVR